MYNLPNISVREFYELDEIEVLGYLDLQTVLNAKNLFCGKVAKPLGQFTYGQVAEFKNIIQAPTADGLFQLFKTLYDVKIGQYLSASIIDYFYALKWIRAEIISLNEREKNALSSEPDQELKAAGVDRLQRFKEGNVLIDFAERFSKTLDEIENWKYNVVFMILLRDKVKAEIENNYRQIKKANNGN